jgi:hypothetical protein
MTLTETNLATWLGQTIPPASHSDGTVILLCGIAGSGKTTAAQHLESKGFLRLSIDEEIWSTYGRYGIDYPAAEYPNLQKQAAKAASTPTQLSPSATGCSTSISNASNRPQAKANWHLPDARAAATDTPAAAAPETSPSPPPAAQAPALRLARGTPSRSYDK